jgi:hypothetical protein
MPDHPADALTGEEARIASTTPVWIVWWEEPEKSWEAICVSESEADRLFAARASDPVLQRWGKTGRRDRQSLLEWLSGHLRTVHASSAGDYTEAAREVMKRRSEAGSEPVTIRTW